ncbi:MAG: putative S-layer protein [Candidatus Pacearchaeota archaeon]
MKLKILLTLEIALLLAVMVNAIEISVSPSTLTFNPTVSNLSFSVSNLNSSILKNVSIPSQVTLSGENGYNIIFNIVGDRTNINSSDPRVFYIIPITSIDYSKFLLEKSYSSSIPVNDGNETVNINIGIQNQYCSFGRRGDISIDVDFKNKGKFGDEDEWYPFEEIEAEITVKNRANENIDDIIVSWGLYNKRTGEFIIDNEERKFDLKKKDEKTITISFSINPKDLEDEDDEDDFVFFIKASSDDLGESSQCDFIRKFITIPRDKDFVVVGDISLPSTVKCGDTVTLRANVWNIGSRSQEDIVLKLFNKNLGLDKSITVGDLDSLENKKVSFDFTIPKNLTSPSVFYLEFWVYDEDGNVYESDSGIQSVFYKELKVEGDCEVPKSVEVLSSVDADIYAGTETLIKVTLKNTGSSSTNYQILVSNYDSWASLKSIEPRSVTLSAGETKEIFIRLVPNKSSVGEREILVQVLYGNLITEKIIPISVQKPESFFSSFTGLSISEIIGDNWFIWVIGAINLVLLILIIIIVIRIIRK